MQQHTLLHLRPEQLQPGACFWWCSSQHLAPLILWLFSIQLGQTHSTCALDSNGQVRFDRVAAHITSSATWTATARWGQTQCVHCQCSSQAGQDVGRSCVRTGSARLAQAGCVWGSMRKAAPIRPTARPAPTRSSCMPCPNHVRGEGSWTLSTTLEGQAVHIVRILHAWT